MIDIPKNFTPGPWQVGPTSDEPGLPEIAIVTPDGACPAVAIPLGKATAANARLIALAPNMAAELTALRADVQRLTDALAAAEAHQPTPEAVERAAEAAYEHFRGPAKKAFVPWRRLPEFGKQEWRARAIAALRSALSDPAS